MRLPRDWPRLRHAAKDRANWRSELSGRPGRLEVHHRRGREFNDDADLQVLTRTEHIRLHQAEREAQLSPGRLAWGAYVTQLAREVAQ